MQLEVAHRIQGVQIRVGLVRNGAKAETTFDSIAPLQMGWADFRTSFSRPEALKYLLAATGNVPEVCLIPGKDEFLFIARLAKSSH